MVTGTFTERIRNTIEESNKRRDEELIRIMEKVGKSLNLMPYEMNISKRRYG
jgi:hypothetical protein